jgi:hypothetical protein
MTLQTRQSRALGLIEKTILGFIAGAAAAIGIVDVVMLVGRVIRLATEQAITLTGVPLVEADAVSVREAASSVVAAHYETVAITVDGAPPAVRGYLIAAAILGTLVSIGICVVLAWLCLRVFVGRPFVTSATWGIGLVAILVILGGLGSSLASSIANAEAIEFLALDSSQGLMAFEVSIDLAPLGWGLALAVVAGAFEIGQRMQRDTTGLV